MATNFVVANINFDWAGYKVRVGDVFVDTHVFYVKFPTRFDRQQTYVTGSPGTVLTGGTLGTVIAGKLPVTDSAGTVLGYVPMYNEITGS